MRYKYHRRQYQSCFKEPHITWAQHCRQGSEHWRVTPAPTTLDTKGWTEGGIEGSSEETQPSRLAIVLPAGNAVTGRTRAVSGHRAHNPTTRDHRTTPLSPHASSPIRGEHDSLATSCCRLFVPGLSAVPLAPLVAIVDPSYLLASLARASP